MAEREVIESFEGKPLYYSAKRFPLIFTLRYIEFFAWKPYRIILLRLEKLCGLRRR